jgi:hypothetical protein
MSNNSINNNSYLKDLIEIAKKIYININSSNLSSRIFITHSELKFLYRLWEILDIYFNAQFGYSSTRQRKNNTNKNENYDVFKINTGLSEKDQLPTYLNNLIGDGEDIEWNPKYSIGILYILFFNNNIDPTIFNIRNKTRELISSIDNLRNIHDIWVLDRLIRFIIIFTKMFKISQKYSFKLLYK